MKVIRKAIQKHSQTAGKRNEIDEILVPVLLGLRIYGLQILDPDWTWKKYGAYRIVNFALIIYTTVGTLEVCRKTKDLNLIIEGICTLLINVQMPFKFLLFISQRVNIQKNYVKLKIIYDSVKEASTEKRNLIGKNLKLLVKFLFFMVVPPVVMYLFIALWFAFNGNRVTLSRSTSSLMPMTSPYHELGLLIHLFYLMEASFCLVVIDLWYILMCMFFIEASEIAMKFLDVKRHGDSANDYAKLLDDGLRRFYFLHVEIIEYLNTINEIYQWICLIPLLCVLMLTSLFLMLINEQINIQLGAVMLPATGEIFAYNYFGERVSASIEKMNTALFNFDWTSMTVKDQKKYYVMVCYTNKKIGIKSAFGNDLSLLTLSNIYKTSYQMFTVFNST